MANVRFDRPKRRDPKARTRHVRLSGTETRASAGPWSRLTSHKTGFLQTFVPQADGSGPRRVLDRIKRPVAFHPGEDRVVQDRIERGAVGAYPGSDGSVPPALAARLMAAGRVDVHAADNVPGAGAKHRVGEPAALSEVLCVPLQVAEIVAQRHLVRPAAVREPRRRPDVVHAGRPGGVIGLVVLRPERGQPEFPGYEPVGYREVVRNEQLIAHPAILTRLRRQARRHTGLAPPASSPACLGDRAGRCPVAAAWRA